MKKSDGFTLIEVLVSVVILSVGIVLVLQALETATVALSEMRDAVWASTIAQGEFDKIRVRAMGGGDPSSVRRQDIVTTYYGDFRIDRSVSDAELPAAGDDAPDIRRVLISVKRVGSVRSHEYETFVRVAKIPDEDG